MLGSLLIPLMYIKSKKCRHHPSQIFFSISVCQSLSCYNLLVWSWNTKKFISYFAMDQMFENFFSLNIGSSESQNNLCAINYGSFYLFFMANVCYNICLCIDLIITLKNPLYPGRKRNKIYHLLTGLNCVICLIVLSPTIMERCESMKGSSIFDDMYKISQFLKTFHLVYL